MNIRALFLHNLSDALASVAVMLGGALILLYDWRLVDPLVTIGIALYVLYLAPSEIGGAVRTLMLGSPDHIDNAEVIAAVCAVEGVVGVHHVHFWQMQEHAAALDCHVVLTGAGWPAQETVKAAIKAMLANRFGIGHSTLEFEHVDRAHDGAALYGCHDGPLGGGA